MFYDKAEDSITLTCTSQSAVTIFRLSELADEPVIFPTDTIYGIGAVISSSAAQDKIYAIKERGKDKPFPVLIGSWGDAELLADIPSAAARKWLQAVWPGPFTVVLPASKIAVQNYPYLITNGKIALRMPDLAWLTEAINATSPITATSINTAGEPPMLEFDEIYERFNNKCKFMLRGVAGSKPSTVIDITTTTGSIIRT